MPFSTLGFSADLLRAVAAQGDTRPTPIQLQAIPAVLSRRDVLAGAQTGTGKTAAFTLPMLHLLSKSNGQHRSPRCLVLTPTRELAAQVGESVRTYPITIWATRRRFRGSADTRRFESEG